MPRQMAATKRLRRTNLWVPAALIAIIFCLTGCVGSQPGISTVSVTAGSSSESSSSADQAEPYVLGSPSPTCSLAVASWGARSAGGTSVVVNARGPVPITVIATGKAGNSRSESVTIPAGEDVHEFDLPDDPVSIVTVVVRAGDSPRERGGQCTALHTDSQ